MLCSFERQIWLNDCQLEIVPLEGNKNDDEKMMMTTSMKTYIFFG